MEWWNERGKSFATACLFFKCFSIGESLQTARGRTCSQEDFPCSACPLALIRWSPLIYLNSGQDDFSFVYSGSAVLVYSSACRLSSASLLGSSSHLRGPPDAHPPFCLEAGVLGTGRVNAVSAPHKKGGKRECLLLLAKWRNLGQIEQPPNLIEPLNVYSFYLG